MKNTTKQLSTPAWHRQRTEICGGAPTNKNCRRRRSRIGDGIDIQQFTSNRRNGQDIITMIRLKWVNYQGNRDIHI